MKKTAATRKKRVTSAKPATNKSILSFKTVLSVNVKDHEKRVVTTRGSKTPPLLMHRFAMLGVGNRIHVEQRQQRRMWAISENDKPDLPVLPAFEKFDTQMLAGARVQTRIGELVTTEDFQDYSSLEAFHYRGIDFSAETDLDGERKHKSAGGRRAILLLRIKLGSNWVAAGYIELQMPLMMAKPRHIAFNRPYKHPTLKVTWETWEKGGAQLVNRIVRIARVVVHPEMRGAGLSSLLVQSSAAFARERWHIGGKRPLFLEISAEMLRHIDFVSSSGFHYLGDTQGNRDRIAKDLRSIRNGAAGVSGIMSLQRRYFNLFETYRKKSGETFEGLQGRMTEILEGDEPWSKMTLDEWLALRPVIRSPIPYYMLGLDAYSDNYVAEASVAKPPIQVRKPAKRPAIAALEAHGLRIWSDYELPVTPYNRMVMNAFGITTRRLKTRLAGPTSFKVEAGSILFIAGSSGCGKSVLLSSLDNERQSTSILKSGKLFPRHYKAGWLQPLPTNIPIFEYLASRHGPERSFDALSRVGLSEAMLFLKPFDLLSRGQRYRAMLADLVLGDDDVWLIDEFCSDLDPLSARIVAHRLRETVRRESRIAVVAAANHGHFISALRPAKVITLALSGGSTTTSWKEANDGILN
jgi:ABC-type lipoprotein export system ATPase subunit/GNAT superfamily N-acetyltransferase